MVVPHQKMDHVRSARLLRLASVRFRICHLLTIDMHSTRPDNRIKEACLASFAVALATKRAYTSDDREKVLQMLIRTVELKDSGKKITSIEVALSILWKSKNPSSLLISALQVIKSIDVLLAGNDSVNFTGLAEKKEFSDSCLQFLKDIVRPAMQKCNSNTLQVIAETYIEIYGVCLHNSTSLFQP